MDYLIEYAKFVTEEIGVDDIEIMHLNFANPQMVDEFYFDRLDYVQQKFNELAEYCETRKIRLRLPSGKYENRTKADNSGYEKYSDCARGGDIFGSQDCLGEYYVWANEDRVNYIEAYDGSKIASCEYWTRLFFKPPTIEFGKPWLKVESCGSCSNFVFGNLKEKSFKEIYNNELFQKVRLFMYNKHELPRGKWAVPCSRCLCQESIYCESNNGPSNVGKRWFLGDDIYGEK
jgi:MoaA/NifB/PqqE/SkfB family radical SAM enzyme